MRPSVFVALVMLATSAHAAEPPTKPPVTGICAKLESVVIGCTMRPPPFWFVLAHPDWSLPERAPDGLTKSELGAYTLLRSAALHLGGALDRYLAALDAPPPLRVEPRADYAETLAILDAFTKKYERSAYLWKAFAMRAWIEREQHQRVAARRDFQRALALEPPAEAAAGLKMYLAQDAYEHKRRAETRRLANEVLASENSWTTGARRLLWSLRLDQAIASKSPDRQIDGILGLLAHESELEEEDVRSLWLELMGRICDRGRETTLRRLAASRSLPRASLLRMLKSAIDEVDQERGMCPPAPVAAALLVEHFPDDPEVDIARALMRCAPPYP